MRKKLWLAILVLVVLAGAGVSGYHVYRLNAVTNQLRPIVARDDVMINEVLNLTGVSPNTTWAEMFEKLDKNREERDERIRQLEILDAYVYKDVLKKYIKLLQLENEYVRTSSLSLRALFNYSNAQDSYRRASKDFDEEEAKGKAALDVGDLFTSKLQIGAMEAASERVEGERREVQENLGKVKEQTATTVDALSEWSNVEQEYYPSLFPARNIKLTIDSRIDTAKKFIGVSGANEVSTTSKSQTQNAEVSPLNEPTVPEMAPTSNPKEAWIGEKYSQTRLRVLSLEEVQDWSDEQRRYAINEMYARHGYAFHNPNAKRPFQKLSWYKPSTSSQSEAESRFNGFEKENLRLLSKIRSHGQAGDDG